MDPDELWGCLAGYILSVLIETPVLLLFLSRRHSLGQRTFLGLWLTACTYPVVSLVLPHVFDVENDRFTYLLVAETFAPLAECGLFWAAFGKREEWGRPSMWIDFTTITAANLLSFGVGEALRPWFQEIFQAPT